MLNRYFVTRSDRSLTDALGAGIDDPLHQPCRNRHEHAADHNSRYAVIVEQVQHHPAEKQRGADLR